MVPRHPDATGAPFGTAAISSLDALRDLVRTIVREELQRKEQQLAEHVATFRASGTLLQAAPERPFLTVGEAAPLLRLSRQAVYARVERGQLPGVVRIGRSIRFRPAELLAFIREGRAPSSRGSRR